MWWTSWGLKFLVFLVTLMEFSQSLGSAVSFERFDDNSVEYYDYDDVLSYLLIYPGTKWCGAGNIATDDNELGSHQQTDSCCRAHDMCDDIIEAGQSKHGLTNTAPYTRLNCKCDEEFRRCLSKATDDMKASHVVGTLYFDLLGQKCFKLEHKIKRCEEYSTIKMKCKKYSIDPHSPKSWQWFDVPHYKS